MNSNDYIPMPTKREKRAAIDSIVASSMPAHRSNISSVVRIFRTLGLRGLFFDNADTVLLSMVCSMAVMIMLAVDVLNASGNYTVTFAAAPILYLLLFCISRWKDRSSGIEQIRYTCVITPVHICIAQSMVFSVCGLAFGSLLAFGTAFMQQNISFWCLWCAALCSQLICSIVTMLALDRRCRLMPDIVAGGCAAVSMLLLMLRHTDVGFFVERLLQSLSATAMTIATVICITVYVLTLWNAVSRSNNILKGEMI